MGEANICTVCVRWDFDEPEDKQILFASTFDELVALLDQVRDRHVERYLDSILNQPEATRSAKREVLGGKTVEITNRWGSIVEVGVGRDACFIFRHRPQPGMWHSDYPPINGIRVFYLDGGHYTELDPDMLVSREECMRVLRNWLDTNLFPDAR